MDRLEKLSIEEVNKLKDSEWFEVIAERENSIVLGYTGFPAALALHKEGEKYQGILDRQSENYFEMVDTIKDLIK